MIIGKHFTLKLIHSKSVVKNEVHFANHAAEGSL